MTANVTTLNVTSIYGTSGFVGIGTSNPLGTSLYVQGNMYVTNSLTTPNISVTNTINAATINVSSLVTPVFNGPTSAFVLASNLTVSNSITVGNLIYSEDLFKRGPYLLPTPSNAATIQNWISATCNAAGQPTKSWWATSSKPIYGNVASGPKGNGDYAGSVLLPDGRVLFVPYNASNVGFFNPATSLFTSVPVTGLSANPGYMGGVLSPSGNVVFCSNVGTNIGIFNPLSYAFSTVSISPYTSGAFIGGILAPTGNVVFIPVASGTPITELNPVTLAFSAPGTNPSLAGSFSALVPSGNVVFFTTDSPNGKTAQYNPYNYTTSSTAPANGTLLTGSIVLSPNGNLIGLTTTGTTLISFNPTNTATPSRTTVSGSSSKWFGGGILLPSGNIILNGSTSIYMVDPNALTLSTIVSGLPTSAFNGMTLLSDGRIVLCPYNSGNVGVISTMVPAPREFCLSPFFNKF